MAEQDNIEQEFEEAHKRNIERIQEEAEFQKKLAVKQKRKNQFQREMAVSNTLQQIFIWLKYRWVSMLLLQLALIATGSLLGVTGRVLWEIWKKMFLMPL